MFTPTQLETWGALFISQYLQTITRSTILSTLLNCYKKKKKKSNSEWESFMSKRFSHSSSVFVRGGSLHRRGRGETEFIRQVCSRKRREELHLMGELDVVNQRVTGSSRRRTRVTRGRASGAYRFPFISCLH